MCKVAEDVGIDFLLCNTDSVLIMFSDLKYLGYGCYSTFDGLLKFFSVRGCDHGGDKLFDITWSLNIC
jgi:hypothetical protein